MFQHEPYLDPVDLVQQADDSLLQDYISPDDVVLFTRSRTRNYHYLYQIFSNICNFLIPLQYTIEESLRESPLSVSRHTR